MSRRNGVAVFSCVWCPRVASIPFRADRGRSWCPHRYWRISATKHLKLGRYQKTLNCHEKGTIAYEFLIEYNIELAALSIHLLLIFKFLNSCILFNIGPMDTKPKIFPNLIRLFLTVWVSCCLSHNKPTSTQPSPV